MGPGSVRRRARVQVPDLAPVPARAAAPAARGAGGPPRQPGPGSRRPPESAAGRPGGSPIESPSQLSHGTGSLSLETRTRSPSRPGTRLGRWPATGERRDCRGSRPGTRRWPATGERRDCRGLGQRRPSHWHGPTRSPSFKFKCQ
jgi:hypothetical protein